VKQFPFVSFPFFFLFFIFQRLRLVFGFSRVAGLVE